MLRTCMALALSLSALGASSQSITPTSALAYGGNGYVAAGKLETVTSTGGFEFLLSPYNTRSTVQISVDNPDAAGTGAYEYAFLILTGNPGADLSVGRYTDVGLAPFESPGENFGANNHGIDSNFGSSFNVLGIAFDTSGVLTSLAVDFKQYDTFELSEVTNGSLRYQSDIPLSPVPEPASVVLLGAGLLMVARACMRKGK